VLVPLFMVVVLHRSLNYLVGFQSFFHCTTRR
jgi:hypothetical protein